MRRVRAIVKSERGVWEPKLSEEQILRVIVEEIWLRHRIKLWRINCPVGGKVRPNERGIPDLMGWTQVPIKINGTLEIVTPRPIFIEVKVPGGRRRPEQVRFIEEAKAAGCVALFAESYEDVERELKGGV